MKMGWHMGGCHSVARAKASVRWWVRQMCVHLVHQKLCMSHSGLGQELVLRQAAGLLDGAVWARCLGELESGVWGRRVGVRQNLGAAS